MHGCIKHKAIKLLRSSYGRRVEHFDIYSEITLVASATMNSKRDEQVIEENRNDFISNIFRSTSSLRTSLVKDRLSCYEGLPSDWISEYEQETSRTKNALVTVDKAPKTVKTVIKKRYTHPPNT